MKLNKDQRKQLNKTRQAIIKKPGYQTSQAFKQFQQRLRDQAGEKK